MIPEPQTKTRSRARSRRVSACYRHPSEPVTGFCALCLRERLAGLEPSGDPSSSTSTSTSVLASSLNNSITAGTSGRPELRRSKSVSVGKCEAASSEPRRNSCDVRGKNTLSHLFNLDDGSKGLNLEVKVESNNLGISRIKKKDLRGENEYGEEVRFSEDVLVPNVISDNEIKEEEDLKTMKEHIDLEWQSTKHKVRDFKDIGGSFKAAASVFSKKLQKWRQKQRIKKLSSHQREEIGDKGGMIARETQSEVAECGFGRRSCDSDHRFSVDANRMSMDDSRFSFDEPRASWDGYLIARTIPRLTPMLSVVENMMSNRPEEQMHSVKEDETSSGLSAQSNSDTLSSQRRSSFDCLSSIRSSYMKPLGLEEDEAKLIANYKASPAYSDVFNGSKLIITEKELKDWHLNSLKDDHSKRLDLVSKGANSDALNGLTKLTRWRKVGNIWSFKYKQGDKKNENLVGNAIRNPVTEPYEEQSRGQGVEKGVSSGNLICSMSIAETGECAKKGTEEFVLERNKSAKYSFSNFDKGLLRFYLPPFRGYRSKSGKSRLRKSSLSIAEEVLRLS